MANGGYEYMLSLILLKKGPIKHGDGINVSSRCGAFENIFWFPIFEKEGQSFDLQRNSVTFTVRTALPKGLHPMRQCSMGGIYITFYQRASSGSQVGRW